MGSLVVPGVGSAITLSSKGLENIIIPPNNVLTKLDFPTFYRPIMESIIGFLNYKFSLETPYFS